MYKLILGDCLDVMHGMDAGSVDAIVTDPPYSSGGQFRGDRVMTTRNKYVNSEDKENHSDFAGDNRDQRAYLLWCSIWLSQCLKIAKPGAVACLFTDWRQLPTTTDALQCGGWIWRGIVPWNKTEAARPQQGRFRQQCEYVVWGTAGPMIEQTDICLPGFFTYSTMNTNNGKEHIAQKPESLITDILGITSRGAVVFDPFMGSGTTGVACMQLGRNFIGIEIDPRYYAIAERRIEQASRQQPLFAEAGPDAGTAEQQELIWDALRDYVLDRDGHACQKCHTYFKRGKDLRCHHIKPKEIGGTDSSRNLLTLCAKCHEDEHPIMPEDDPSDLAEKTGVGQSEIQEHD